MFEVLIFIYALGSGVVIGYSFSNAEKSGVTAFETFSASLLSWVSLIILFSGFYYIDKKYAKGTK